MTVEEALKTVDWTRIHPCGHPTQKFKGSRAIPPCATCSGHREYYLSEDVPHNIRLWVNGSPLDHELTPVIHLARGYFSTSDGITGYLWMKRSK